MKYAVGEFQLILFGEYGEKLKTKSYKSVQKAKPKYNKHIAKNPRYSAVINRTIHNSLNNNDKWSYNG